MSWLQDELAAGAARPAARMSAVMRCMVDVRAVELERLQVDLKILTIVIAAAMVDDAEVEEEYLK